MKQIYKGEDRGAYLDPVTKQKWNVHYFTDIEKSNYEVFIRNGKIVDKNGLAVESILDAETASFESSIFIIDKDFRIFILPFEERGRYHHSSLSHGENVFYAGSITVVSGNIYELDDRSGHYKPNEKQTLRVVEFFKREGLSLNNLKLSGHAAHSLSGDHVLTPNEVSKYLKEYEDLEIN